MASRLDDLLNSVVNRLQSVGVGRRTQRQPEQVPYGFRPYEGYQNLATERLVNIGGRLISVLKNNHLDKTILGIVIMGYQKET